ncbi:low affinity immunoglobulin gamma Fc region receptor III-A-like [Hyla sarda]|uniref:low affinity immunoglobulin gamma Fc region receptor III-A-like n=1 Tax=Hyla sarda TaxID=327740 RepID=UPI0024C368DE|nr:low affinity immunoglobulin gamma Fc region receptor III-A-like [Hyla sarda]
MRVPILLLILSAATNRCGTEVQPVVTFTPNWRIILLYESVTISCNIGSATQENPRYDWSKDGELLPHHEQRISIDQASYENSGRYQCWVNKALKSDPVRLDVIGGRLILQSPPIIYIGDPLTLRCHSHLSYDKTNTTFFKNKTIIGFSVSDTELRFASVDQNVTGAYRCTQKIRTQQNNYKVFQAMTFVSVQERPQTSPGEMAPMTIWILVGVFFLFLLFSVLLIFMCRHKLHQQHTITERERKDYLEEDEVYYTYIHPDCLQRGLPSQRRDSHDYSTVYSVVMAAPTSENNVEGAETSMTPDGT